MTISSAGTPSPVTTTGAPVQAAWGTGQNRTAGRLLLAAVTAGCSSGAASPPTTLLAGTGWSKLFEGTQTRTAAAIWGKTAAGGDAAPEFSSGISGVHQQMSATLFELADSGGSTPVVDTDNTGSNGGTSPLTVISLAAVAGAGEFAIGVVSVGSSTLTSTNSFTPGGSWVDAFDDGGGSTNYHWMAATQAGPASGSTLTFGPGWSQGSTDGASAALIVVKAGTPPPPSGNGDFFLVI